MSWQQPKTDWKVHYNSDGSYAGDYFEATDYQRIKNNLLFLHELALTMYPKISSLTDIPDVTTASFGYASYINALERGLDVLAGGSFDPGIPSRKTWQGNDTALLASDLNRIESSCLQLYQALSGQEKCLPRLSFILGGVQF